MLARLPDRVFVMNVLARCWPTLTALLAAPQVMAHIPEGIGVVTLTRDASGTWAVTCGTPSDARKIGRQMAKKFTTKTSPGYRRNTEVCHHVFRAT